VARFLIAFKLISFFDILATRYSLLYRNLGFLEEIDECCLMNEFSQKVIALVWNQHSCIRG